MAFEVGALIQLNSCRQLVSIYQVEMSRETHLLVGYDPDVGTSLGPVEELVDHGPHRDGINDTWVSNGEMNRTAEYLQHPQSERRKRDVLGKCS